MQGGRTLGKRPEAAQEPPQVRRPEAKRHSDTKGNSGLTPKIVQPTRNTIKKIAVRTQQTFAECRHQHNRGSTNTETSIYEHCKPNANTLTNISESGLQARTQIRTHTHTNSTSKTHCQLMPTPTTNTTLEQQHAYTTVNSKHKHKQNIMYNARYEYKHPHNPSLNMSLNKTIHNLPELKHRHDETPLKRTGHRATNSEHLLKQLPNVSTSEHKQCFFKQRGTFIRKIWYI